MRWRFPVMDCFWNFARLWDNCCLCFLCFFLTRHPRAQIQSVQWRFFVIVVFVFSFDFLKLFTTTTSTTTSYFCIGLYCARERKNGERKKNISKNFLFRAPKIPLPPPPVPIQKKHKTPLIVRISYFLRVNVSVKVFDAF